ncbi:MAG: hypothetical protein AAF989_16620 [Planctomycetota bacterium]
MTDSKPEESPEISASDARLRRGHADLRFDPEVRDRLRRQLLSDDRGASFLQGVVGSENGRAAENDGRTVERGSQSRGLGVRRAVVAVLATCALLFVAIRLASENEETTSPSRSLVQDRMPIEVDAEVSSVRPVTARHPVQKYSTPESVVRVEGYLAVALPSDHEDIEIIQLFPSVTP